MFSRSLFSASRYSTISLSRRSCLLHTSTIDKADGSSKVQDLPTNPNVSSFKFPSTDKAYADRVRKPGFSRINEPAAVYDLFKQLVHSQRSVHSRGVVTNALQGVLDGNFLAEFVVHYFESWWKEFVFHLEDPQTDFFLVNNVNTLGRINAQTNGELTRYFTVKVLQFLVSKFSATDFNQVRPVDLFVFYNGMSHLTYGQSILNAKIISDDLVEKTLNALSTVHPNTGTLNLLEIANAYASFLNCLTKLGGSLSKDQFEKSMKFFKSAFDDKDFQNVAEKSIDSIDYGRKARILHNFGESFSTYRINPDHVVEGVLSSWLVCWRNFLSVVVDMPHWERKPGEKWPIQLLKRVRFASTETVNICNSACELATMFDKERALEDNWPLLINALIKTLPYATSDVVFRFSSTLRQTMLHLEAKSVVDPNFHSEARNLLDDKIIQLVSRKIEEQREYRRNLVLKQHDVAMATGRSTTGQQRRPDELDGGFPEQMGYRQSSGNF